MIDQRRITTDWINEISASNRNLDKTLIEKAIRALLLLEGLVIQRLDFVFKGGTALLLRFSEIKRLSIDIDIILPHIEELDASILDAILESHGFTRYERQKRNPEISIKKDHFKLYYKPVFQTYTDEDYILLDVLYESINYSAIELIDITSPIIPETGEAVKVALPSLENHLGDKLTAFAPNTTGIPYIKGEASKSMEIIKQLFDVGNLFNDMTDISAVRDSFFQIATTEMSYRTDKNMIVDDVLDDIFGTSLCVASRGKLGNGRFTELQDGIKKLKSFIHGKYAVEDAILHASQAAYLSRLIKNEMQSFQKYDESMDIKDLLIEGTAINKLNKLKKTNPQAFYYWYLINKM